MKKYRIANLLLALLICFTSILKTNVSVDASEIARDTVLVLDASGSMAGDAMDSLKDAAFKFSNSVLAADGENRVAIVSYASDAVLVCDFTNDINALMYSIDNMYAYGMTNIYDALGEADRLLESSVAKVKNIVLMSDGLPNEGAVSETGMYIYNDYAGYDYANAVYNQAVSYHSDYYIYTLGFYHSMYEDEKVFATRFLTDLQNAGYYEVDAVENLEFTFGEIAEEIVAKKQSGTFRYESDKKDYEATYFYDDAYFYDDSTEYNSSLATMSLCLALSAFGSGDAGNDYTLKSQNVIGLFDDLGFNHIYTTDTYDVKPGSDTIAAAIAQNPIKDDDGNKYTLLTVAVRGGGYEKEWASNFTIGQSGVNHQGFDEAAQYVLNELEQYINDSNNEVEGNIKIWITGYSRAAATANLVAAEIDKRISSGNSIGSNIVLDKEDVYAYTFETPVNTTDNDAKNMDVYNNIFNIINPNDLVTKVAPVSMGFKRYGIDKVLPTRENKYNSYSRLRENMLGFYDKLESSGEYVLDDFAIYRFNVKKIIPGGDSAFELIPNNTQSICSFLDEAISKLVNDYVNRDVFALYMQDGIREICKAIYEDESKATKIIQSVIDKFDGKTIATLLLRISIDEAGVYDTVAGYLIDSMRAEGIYNFDEDKIRETAVPLLDILLSYIFNNPDYLATIVENKSIYTTAHYPELCLAWMQTQDVNYTTDAGEAFSSGSYRVIHINCPVDAEVYDSYGSLVASIVNDEPQHIDGSSISAIINGDGEKIIYLPPDAEFNIVMNATAEGEVTYSVNEFSFEAGNVNRLVNYYDVPVETGDQLKAVVPAYDEYYLTNGTYGGTSTMYKLYDADGNELVADLDIGGDAAINSFRMVTAESENPDQGAAIGSGSRRIGNFAEVSAIAEEGYSFDAWYIGDEKVSTDVSYRFCVTEDVTLTAKFVSNEAPVTTEPEIEEEDKEIIGWSDTGVWICVVAVILIIVCAIAGIIALVLSGKKADNGAYEIPIINKTKPAVDQNDKQIEVKKIEREISIVNGSMRGFSAPINSDEIIYIGKDPTVSNIVISKDYYKVSRLHCSVIFDSKFNKYFVTDTSRNGTSLADGTKLEMGKRTAVHPGSRIMLADDECIILLK